MKVTTIASRALFTALALALATQASAAVVVIDYEDLTEGAQGDPLLHQDINYYDLNNVSGVFPDGSPFDPEPNDEFLVEDATAFYAEFPGFGSPVNVLTFGTAFIPGENLSLGRLSTVTLDLPGEAQAASLDLGYLENGPWGGIVFHLDGLIGGTVIASDSFEIADAGGRDNGAWNTLAISTDQAFDQLHIYATFGTEYSLPRAIIDDLTIDYIEATPTLETSWGAIKGNYR